MKLRLLCLLLICAATVRAQPAPGHITTAAGSFVFGPETTVMADRELLPLAGYLSEYLGRPVAREAAGASSIVLIIDERPGARPEQFTLRISPEFIVVSGNDYGGIFNGIQRLLRLLPPEVYTRQGIADGFSVACATIEDAPRFTYRGMMLDVARTWIDPLKVKHYIDLLSFHNINKLHLHLSDDEGWRIEIRSHPELAEIGGFRGGDSPVRPVYGKWDEKYGGYYTQAEMRDLVAYAALRNVEIIPEIDLPGHSRCIASVRPEIRCNYPPDTVSTNGYDYRSAWCVAREQNYALLADILGELCELFPSEYIHIGGDEVDLSQWERCPDCRALMRRRGMTDPHRLEDLFMERTTAILAAHGKRAGVWNEAVRTGTLSRDSRVYGWENSKAALDAVAKGYPTVVMPAEYFYFDMRQSPHEDGHDWAAVFDAKKTYGFDFADKGFSPERMRNVLGLQGSFFSEAYVSHAPETTDYLDYMLFPRVCALSRLAWSGNDEGWDTYYKELRTEHYDRMAAMGIRFRLFPPKVAYKDGTFTVTTDDGSEIYYLEGDSPQEHRYTGPLRTDKPHRYRFFTRYKTGRSPFAAHKSYYRTVAPAVTITTSMGESSRFPYTNAAQYRGISRTRRACRQRDWILYTFDQPVRCREMFLQTGNRQLPKTILTTGYAEVSYDGTTFSRWADLEKGAVTLRCDRPVKAVRLISTCDDNGTPYVTIQPPQIKP